MRKRSRVLRTSIALIPLVEKYFHRSKITKKLVDAIQASGTSDIQVSFMKKSKRLIRIIGIGLLTGNVAEARGSLRDVYKHFIEVNSLMSTISTLESTYGRTGVLRFISRKLDQVIGRRRWNINILMITSYSSRSSKRSLMMKDLEG
jgi:hypothetical protein